MQTDLNQCMGELVEQLPCIGDMANAKVALGGLGGALVGPVGGQVDMAGGLWATCLLCVYW